MAGSTGRQAAPRPGAAASSRQWLAWSILVLILVAAALSVFVLPVALLVAAGMLPTLVAWVTEGPRHRYLAHSLASMNFVGVLPLAVDLWSGGADMHRLAQVLSDPLSWLVMLAAAGVGWVIYLVVPPLYTGFAAIGLRRRFDFVVERQRVLEAEWGLSRSERDNGGV